VSHFLERNDILGLNKLLLVWGKRLHHVTLCNAPEAGSAVRNRFESRTEHNLTALFSNSTQMPVKITDGFLPNSNKHFTKIGCEGVHWIHLAQERVQWKAAVYTVMNLSAL
jgi:hypothetical protein